MTRKIFTVIAAAVLTATTMTARHLTPEEALARLNGDNTTQRARALAGRMVKTPVMEVKTAADASEPQIYVFNQPLGRGFMILPADDVAKPILGYSESASFNPNDVPANMQWWLEEYARQIEWAQQNTERYEFGIVKSTANDYAPIAPMVTTQWNQSAPYNNLSPIVGGERSVTGCVATGIAQVLAHNKFPEKFTGKVSYNWVVAGDTLHLDADLDTIPINYNLMRDIYDEENPGTLEEQLAVARLMYACGAAVNMKFTPNESGASSLTSLEGAYNYMGCEQAAMVFAAAYDEEGWNDYVYNHLVTLGPAVYMGTSAAGGGHCFVCDGYDSNGYFHINWGWAGKSDGYFTLQALDPAYHGSGGNGSGYSNNMCVLQGCNRPLPISEFHPSLIGDGGVSFGKITTYETGDTIRIQGMTDKDGFYSYTKTTLEIAYGIQLLNVDSKEIKYFPWAWEADPEDFNDDGIIYTNLKFQYGFRSYPICIPKGTPDGHYYLKPCFKLYGGPWYEMPIDQEGDQYVVCDIVDGTCTFSKPVPASIVVDQVQITSPFIAGQAFTMTGRVMCTDPVLKFNGDIAVALGEFYNDIFVSDYQSGTVAVKALPGEYVDFELENALNTKLKGEYDMVFINATSGAIVSEPVKVNVTKYPGAAEIVIKNFNVEYTPTETSGEIYLAYTADIVSGYLSFPLRASVNQIYDLWTTNRANAEAKQEYLPAGESRDYAFRGPVKLPDGNYNCYISYYNPFTRKSTQVAGPYLFTVNTSDAETISADIVSGDITISFDTTSSVLTVTAADQVAVYNTAGQQVAVAEGNGTTSLESLAPGVYVVKAADANGALKAERIVKK